jgi:hypothetical protein
MDRLGRQAERITCVHECNELAAQRGRLARSKLFAQIVLGLLWGLALLPRAPAAELEEVAVLIAKGQAAHDKRCLNEASSFYRDALALDPPTSPLAEQSTLIMKFAPRLHTVPGEFFPLKDIVAVMHPDKPVIAYHLFWDDDIDFPADNEPADHEIVWVEFDPATKAVTQISTYLHGYIVHGEEAAAEANVHGGRPWVGVEWGKHGSLAWGAADGSEGAGKVLHHNWTALHNEGRKRQDHPLARGWPLKFTGDFSAYKNFSVELDPRDLLQERKLTIVSRWPNAAINQHCLRYNFAPKTEWPWLPPVRR